jgi:hypothetical protein
MGSRRFGKYLVLIEIEDIVLYLYQEELDEEL